MRAKIFRLWQRLKSIPSILRALTILSWVLGSFVIIASVTLGWEDEAGLPVSLGELWSEGHGLMAMIFGFGMLILGIFIYNGWAWVRHALMLGIVSIGLSGFVQCDYAEVPVEILSAIALIPIGAGVRYFYFQPEVVRYFTRQR